VNSSLQMMVFLIRLDAAQVSVLNLSIIDILESMLSCV
jgi:hypothetical protein